MCVKPWEDTNEYRLRVERRAEKRLETIVDWFITTTYNVLRQHSPELFTESK
jgi:hypothetical protein